MRRRVVLHLLRRVEVVVPDGHRRRVSDAVATAKRRERRIRERDALRDELIVDPHQIAAAAIDPLEDLIAVRLTFSARSIRGTVGVPALRTIRTAPGRSGGRAM